MAAVWYYLKNGQRLGPVSAADLKNLATAGELVPDDPVWKEGMAGWEPARSVKGLFEFVRISEGHPSPFPPPPAHAESDSGSFEREPPPLVRKPSFLSRHGLGVASLVLAAAAFVLALLAFLRPSPLGRGSSGYDMSTPENALRARLQIAAARDLVAREELDALLDDPTEMVSTLVIKETLTAVGKEMKIVLFSYKRGGREKRDFWGFVKHPGKEVWIKKAISAYDPELHAEFARRLTEWRSKEFDPETP